MKTARYGVWAIEALFVLGCIVTVLVGIWIPDKSLSDNLIATSIVLIVFSVAWGIFGAWLEADVFPSWRNWDELRAKNRELEHKATEDYNTIYDLKKELAAATTPQDRRSRAF